MRENQNTEWKEAWRDEYLKWLCGFANAEGGVLVIGRSCNSPAKHHKCGKTRVKPWVPYGCTTS